MTFAETILLILGAFGGAVFIWFLNRRQTNNSHTDQHLATFERHLGERFDRIATQLDHRLRDNVRAMNESKTFLADRVSHTERAVRDVTASLSKLQQATSALKDSTDEITSFQRLLRSPKVRGSFGEVLLNNLLGDVLPRDRYEIQHTLPGSGEICDAAIKLQDGYIVAIDAKFPLANFETFANEDDPVRKKQMRAQLMRDIKKHVTDISRKYISPNDHTLDYAFMYIPMEGVYYETMVRDADGGGLWEFCIKHKVVPVSPNSILAYLHTILVGLRGMKIQEQAKEILVHLGQIHKDFQTFGEDFSVVGKHLTNARNKYDESTRRLDKITNRLDQIGDSSSPTPQIQDQDQS
jgi:DNA recombination protein RmuC